MLHTQQIEGNEQIRAVPQQIRAESKDNTLMHGTKIVYLYIVIMIILVKIAGSRIIVSFGQLIRLSAAQFRKMCNFLIPSLMRMNEESRSISSTRRSRISDFQSKRSMFE